MYQPLETILQNGKGISNWNETPNPQMPPLPARVDSAQAKTSKGLPEVQAYWVEGGEMKIRQNLIGKRFGRRVVVSLHGYINEGSIGWNCVCDCGTKSVISTGALNRGNSGSCGCLKKEKATRQYQEHKSEYKAWQSMKQRCYNPNQYWYKRYGGRGIKVCKRWLHSFENFFSDIGSKPSPSHSVDRKNNYLNYTPSNCRWATSVEQENNRCNNLLVTFDGKTKTAVQWSRIVKINAPALYERLRRGWSVVDALFIPKGCQSRLEYGNQ